MMAPNPCHSSYLQSLPESGVFISSGSSDLAIGFHILPNSCQTLLIKQVKAVPKCISLLSGAPDDGHEGVDG